MDSDAQDGPSDGMGRPTGVSPPHWLVRSAHVARAVAARLEAAAEREGRRLFLFTPILLGLGIAAYFSAAVEPSSLAAAVTGLSGILLGGFALIRVPGRLGPVLACLLALPPVGFSLAKLRTAGVAAPMLAREIGPVRVEGRLVEISFTDERSARLVLEPMRIERLDARELPARARLTARGDPAALRMLDPGAPVSALAILRPPSPPVAPGDYDFARAAYFDRLGAIGYTLGVPKAGGPAQSSPSVLVANIRGGVTERLRREIGAFSGPQAAGIAAALVTGDRGGIGEVTYALLRDSGLAHIIAISGLHLALVAGGAFWALRLFLALLEGPALLWPTKKIAAVAGLAVALAYLLLAGAPVPALRSCLMLAVVFAAILADRVAISMRHVAVAALVILALMPESLLEPGFQMSFAAVVGLIAFYETVEHRSRDARPDQVPLIWRMGARATRYVAMLAATSLVAGAATAPFAAYHFNRFSNLEMLANLVAVPLMGTLVMPAALLGVLAMPLGLEDAPLWAMGKGIEAILWVADAVSHLPGAVTRVPSASAVALGIVTLSLAWTALMTRHWRWAGMAGLLVGIGIWALTPRPVLLVDATGRTVGLRAGDGAFVIDGAARDRFTAEMWLEREGEADRTAEAAKMEGRLACDALGCAGSAGGFRVALARSGAVLAEDCRWADILVAPFAVGRCPSAAIVIDRAALAKGGAHAVYAEGGRLRVETVADWRGQRPWTGARK